MPSGAKYSEMSKIHVHLQSAFFSKFCRNTCFSPDHLWRATFSNTDSTGPVYSDPVQYSNESVENTIGCCGIRHRHQSQEFHRDRQSLINATTKYG